MGRDADVKRGTLVAFEGIDGAGKSTQLARLAVALRVRGHPVVTTAEPTRGPHGRRIRDEARAGQRRPPQEELAWFIADRREHVAEVVAPALDAGQVVLTDRYYLSTVAYQGARGLDPQRLLLDAEAEFPNPDLALLFWVAPAIGLKRARDRGGVGEAAFEEAGVLSAVAEVFSALETPYLVRVDAAGDPDRVHQRVLEIVAERVPALGVPRQR